MPKYKGTIEVMFTADDEDEADVHLLECADYLENASLVLSATGRTIENLGGRSSSDLSSSRRTARCEGKISEAGHQKESESRESRRPSPPRPPG